MFEHFYISIFIFIFILPIYQLLITIITTEKKTINYFRYWTYNTLLFLRINLLITIY